MRKMMWWMVLVVVMVVLPALAGDNPFGLALPDVGQVLGPGIEGWGADRYSSSKLIGQTFESAAGGLLLVSRGHTVEVKPTADDLRLFLVSEGGQLSQFGQEQEAAWQQTVTGVTAGLTGVGIQVVHDSDQVRRVTAQRTEVRANDEVNQASMPGKGTIQQGDTTLTIRVGVGAPKDTERFGGFLTRAVVVSFGAEFRLATDGILLATFGNQVRREWAVRGYSGKELISPVLSKALEVSLATFAQQLRAAAKQTEAYIVAHPGRVPFKLTSGYAWVTLGQHDGVVGSHDGAKTAGTKIRVSGAGHEFTAEAYLSGETASFLSVGSLTTADQELLGQNPTAQIVREGMHPPAATPTGSVPSPAGPPPAAPRPEVPTIEAEPPPPAAPARPVSSAVPSPTQSIADRLAETPPGATIEEVADLIRTNYGAVTVGTADGQLPEALKGLKWLRMSSPRAGSWKPGQVVGAWLVNLEGEVVTSFLAVTVAVEMGRALVWMPSDASTAGRGNKTDTWSIGAEEPLFLTIRAATPGTVIPLPDSVKIDATPPWTRVVRIDPAWFEATSPTRGLVVRLHHEARSPLAHEVWAVVVGKGRDGKIRCLYPVPEQTFDASWTVVVTPPSAVPPPAPEPARPEAETPQPVEPGEVKIDVSIFDQKTEAGRFLLAAARTPYGQVVDGPVPSFPGNVRTGHPKGVRIVPVPIPIDAAIRQQFDPGTVVPAVRTVGGVRQQLKCVVIAHVLDREDKTRAWAYIWTLAPLSGKGWQIELPGLTPVPVQVP